MTRRLRAAITLVLFFLTLAAPGTALAAAEAFLHFGPNRIPELNVTGESLDPTFKGAVALQSFAFNVENATTIGSTAGGAGAGKPKLNNLVIQKRVDRTSPKLFQAMAMGSHYPDMTLSVRQAAGGAGKATGPYLIFKFKTVLVVKIETAFSSGDDAPMESVTLAYGALEESYTPQLTDGSPQTTQPVKGTWNQITNKPDLVVPAVP
jgi:type VI secretion system secreted protein Hcp